MSVNIPLAVGEKVTFWVSNIELALVLGRYVAERQGITGSIGSVVIVHSDGYKLLNTQVTLTRQEG